MNKTLTILLFALSVAFNTMAQQVPFYNHNMINPFIYNPAMAGYSGGVNAFLVQNQRYSGFGTGAVNNYLTIDSEFFIPNSGIGLSISQNSYGIQQQLNAQLSYSYKVSFDEDNHLRFGVTGGYFENKINTSSFDVSHVNDPFLTGLRPSVPTINFNGGLMYERKGSRVGVAIPQLLGNRINHFVEDDMRGYYSLERHFMATLEHDFKFLPTKELVLTPQALLRYAPGAPVQYDITAHLDYRRLGWFSVTYKSDYAVQFNVGYRLKNQLHIGYSYEYVTGSLNNYYNGMNHEFLIGYRFSSGKKDVGDGEVQEINTELAKENRDLKRKLKETEKDLEVQKKVYELLNEQLTKEIAKRESMEKDLTQDETSAEEEQELDSIQKVYEIDITESMGNYKLIELDGYDAPEGLYVVAGVFSDQENLDKNVKREKTVFPDTYVLLNMYNNYYYVIIKHTKSRREAFDVLKKHRKLAPTDKNVWILDYR